MIRVFPAANFVFAVLASIILWGCGQQDPAKHTSETQTSDQIAAATDENPEFAATRAALEQDGMTNWTSVSLTSTQEQWLPTGLQVKAGVPLTVFGFGAIEFDAIRLESRHLVWIRIGEDGDLIQLASDQFTVEPDRSGELYLTIPPLGMYWESPAGKFPEDLSDLPAYPIAMDFIAVQWSDNPAKILQRLTQADDDAFSLALQTLNNPKALPGGFSFLWYLGQSEVFERFDDGERSGVHGYANYDYGIIKKEVDLPLTADSKIGFDWLYTTLPPHGPETEARYHDYLSIAVEFENGQDITWMWSRFLAIEEGFRCPLDWWDERETHVVLQSGTEGLGEWYSHKRNILEDYVAHIGGEVPERIVGVWFIATSLSGTPGDAKFSNVSLMGSGPDVTIFATAD
jgi:hypothetical protein